MRCWGAFPSRGADSPATRSFLPCCPPGTLTRDDSQRQGPGAPPGASQFVAGPQLMKLVRNGNAPGT